MRLIKLTVGKAINPDHVVCITTLHEDSNAKANRYEVLMSTGLTFEIGIKDFRRINRGLKRDNLQES